MPPKPTPGVNPFPPKDDEKPDDKPAEAPETPPEGDKAPPEPPKDEKPPEKPAEGDQQSSAPVSEVTKAIRALQAGERTIEDVEQMFKTRSWPKPQVTPTDATEAFAREEADRDPEPPGSFAEVAQAFYDGIIDVDTYTRLAAAVTEAKSAAPPEPEGDDEGDKEADKPEDEEGDEDEKPQASEGDDEDKDEDEDGDKPEDEDDEDEDEKPKPGTPGVNPFKKKKGPK